MDFHGKTIMELGEWLREEKFSEKVIADFEGNLH